jgi:hypothetical protein
MENVFDNHDQPISFHLIEIIDTSTSKIVGGVDVVVGIG